MKNPCPVPFIAVLVLAFAASALGVDQASSAQLRCEYLENPQGIDIIQPRLSWQMLSAQRGAKQTAYRVLVASSPELLAKDKGDLWDSGKVVSAQSTQVVYSGKPLDSRAFCYWKVKVWDAVNKELRWSEPQNWTMGLLKPADWTAQWISMKPSKWMPDSSKTELNLDGAQWIWQAGVDPKKPIGIAYFAKSIPLQEKIKSATITLTGDDAVSLTVNGEELKKSNDWKNPVTIDLTNKLKMGDNVLEITGENRGDSGGVIGKVQIVPEQGTPVEIVTDASWLSTDKKDQPVAQRQPSQVIGAYGSPPWGRFGPRGPENSPNG